jgi:hypothetical protein
MTIEEAARKLYEGYHKASWYTTVGVGEWDDAPCIYLYVKPNPIVKPHDFSGGWHGYPVQVRTMGTPRAIA